MEMLRLLRGHDFNNSDVRAVSQVCDFGVSRLGAVDLTMTTAGTYAASHRETQEPGTAPDLLAGHVCAGLCSALLRC